MNRQPLLPKMGGMDDHLLLENVRSSLVRQEETIIFALIERAQFSQNAPIYERGRFGDVLQGESLVGFILHECERSHAKVRRYTSPDEEPFYQDLPAPILPSLHYDDSPLVENTINLNPEIRRCYEEDIVPMICQEGDDGQYGSSAVCDVTLLQALSKRIHYGKLVAESKVRANPELFAAAVQARDEDAITGLITDGEVEAAVIQRVRTKAQTYTHEIVGGGTRSCVASDRIADVYKKWIITLNKQVQVAYILQRQPQSK